MRRLILLLVALAMIAGAVVAIVERRSVPDEAQLSEAGSPSVDWRCCEGRVCPRSGARGVREQASHRGPNVLLIVADDLGWNDVGYHGSAIGTPSLDRLAREGVQLERFYASPLCTPTRAALLTGRAALRSGLDYSVVRPWSEIGLPGAETTIAEHFGAAGYQTALVGKWHLGHSRIEYLPNAQGFDEFFGFLLGLHHHYDHTRLGAVDWQHNGVTSDVVGYDTDVFSTHAAHWIEARDPRRPFFLMLSYSAPHRPLQAPEELIEAQAQELRGERRVHAAMVDALDRGIGRVLDTLAREGIDDETIVVFLSDNGGVVGPSSNAPLRGGKGDVWEGGVHVPALIRWSGQLPAGTPSRQRMRELDLLPTLAEAAGVALISSEARPLDGTSVWPMLTAGAVVTRGPFYFLTADDASSEHAVLDDERKYVWRRMGTRRARFLFPAVAPRFGERNRDNRLRAETSAADVYEATVERWKAQNAPGGLTGEDPMPPGWSPPADWTDLVAGPDTDGDGISDACEANPGIAAPDHGAGGADARTTGRGAT